MVAVYPRINPWVLAWRITGGMMTVLWFTAPEKEKAHRGNGEVKKEIKNDRNFTYCTEGGERAEGKVGRVHERTERSPARAVTQSGDIIASGRTDIHAAPGASPRAQKQNTHEARHMPRTAFTWIGIGDENVSGVRCTTRSHSRSHDRGYVWPASEFLRALVSVSVWS